MRSVKIYRDPARVHDAVGVVPPFAPRCLPNDRRVWKMQASNAVVNCKRCLALRIAVDKSGNIR